MVKLNERKYVKTLFSDKDIDLLSSRNRKVKLWVVFKKMYEVLSLKNLYNLPFWYGSLAILIF